MPELSGLRSAKSEGSLKASAKLPQEGSNVDISVESAPGMDSDQSTSLQAQPAIKKERPAHRQTALFCCASDFPAAATNPDHMPDQQSRGGTCAHNPAPDRQMKSPASPHPAPVDALPRSSTPANSLMGRRCSDENDPLIIADNRFAIKADRHQLILSRACIRPAVVIFNLNSLPRDPIIISRPLPVIKACIYSVKGFAV